MSDILFCKNKQLSLQQQKMTAFVINQLHEPYMDRFSKSPWEVFEPLFNFNNKNNIKCLLIFTIYYVDDIFLTIKLSHN